MAAAVGSWPPPAPAAAQLCQVPLSIQKGDVDANIMILLDNSGSMNEVIEHDAYDRDAPPGPAISTRPPPTWWRASGTYWVNGRSRLPGVARPTASRAATSATT